MTDLLGSGFDGERARSKALNAFGMLDAPAEADFDDIAALASAICETPIAVVNLVDTDRQFFLAEIGLGVRSTPLETSFCGHAILADDMIVIEDADADPRFACSPLVAVADGIRFYAGAILRTDDGYPIGTMCVLDRKPRTLSALQVEALRVLARQVMQQLCLRRAVREAEESAALHSVLAGEAAHRVKNILSIVQALVSQTLKTSSSQERAAAVIYGRLGALARAQDLLLSGDASESTVGSVVEAAMTALGGDHRITARGDRAYLSSQQSLALSLGLRTGNQCSQVWCPFS